LVIFAPEHPLGDIGGVSLQTGGRGRAFRLRVGVVAVGGGFGLRRRLWLELLLGGIAFAVGALTASV
jgi:hypothetical protein